MPHTSGRCNRQSEFTVAFYDISVILRSAGALLDNNLNSFL